jgi:hypothetical protein
MGRALGAGYTFAMAYETTYGTAPVTGFRSMPNASSSLRDAQPLLPSELLGYGFDPAAPLRDVITVDGTVRVPVDTDMIGYWLKLLLGSPTTTGTTPKIHTFTSGGATRPSASVELQHPDAAAFSMFSGICAESASFDFGTSGLLTAEFKLIGQKAAAVATTTAAGTVAAGTGTRFGHFNGSVKRDGAVLGNVTGAKLTFANNLDAVRVIRADGLIAGLDPTVASLTGEITVRFEDTVLLAQAQSGATSALEFGWSSGINSSLALTAHQVHLDRPSREVNGPAGIDMTFQLVGARASSPNRMLTAVLTNSVAAY